ncbi:MAG: hypothetical protein EPN85_00135 [Bacteroidetes bacterium]|nr:MAG: hypothetical protein EPN85_00135 [Bacteroidota bacterium]
MIKRTIYLTLLAIPLFLMAKLPEKSSAGAPAAHTGAPGEGNCGTIGCHDDNSTNSGNAILNVDMNAINNYIPGKIYPINIRITEPSVERFGFQLVALVNSDTSNAGNFLLTDVVRTQLVKSQYQFQNREYVTYTYDGTDAVNTGLGEWTVNWKAPVTNQGAITFYASAVSANDDESDKGDHVYTKSLILQPNYKGIELQK